MSVRRVQLRRGTGAENNAFTGAVGELTVNTTNNSIRVHDGATLGGSETALANLANVVPTQNLDLNEYKIVNVADPVDLQDVATKNYVDSQNDLVNSLAELTDVDVAGVAPGEFLKYSGSEWINTTISTADLQDGLDIAMIDAGNITANLIGNADTATAWATAMTLNLTGTVLTGSVSFDGSATANLNASLNDTSISNAKLENSSVNIGAFTLSLGSTLNLSNDFQITGSTLSFAGGGGAPTSLEDLTDTNLGGYVGGQVLVYNPDNNKWENKSVVGDATLSATGTLILSAIENAKLVNSTINIGGSNIALGGTVTLNGGLAMTGSTLSVGNVATASALFSAVTLGIGGSVITGSVSFDGSQSVEIIADVTPLSITNGMIANATITNAKLEHDFIAFNNHEVHLGEEVTINGTEGEISVVANAGVYTIGLAGTLVADSAIALAKTIELAGNATGSVSLDNALGTVTLNVALGTITNAMLEHDFIAINDFQLQLGDNLDVVGAVGITVTMDEPNSIMTIGLGTINTSNLSSNFITFADSDSSENIALGGTLTFLGVDNETSVFVLNGEVNVGLAQDVEIQGNLTIGGSLIVNGTTTSINTVNLDVEDSIVLLGKGTSDLATAVNDAGFIIERGSTQPSASLFWDEGNSHFAVVTADSIGSSTTDIITQANNLAYADFKANSVIANFITGSTLSISADVQLTIDSELTVNDNTNLKGNAFVTSLNPDSFILGTKHENVNTFYVDSSTGDTVVTGDLYASNLIESANGLGITLQDTTSINANLDVYNPTGALIHGTTVYLYAKYGADSIANGEYFHIFKTNDGGSIRQIVPLTLLQDGGQDKLDLIEGGIYQYQAVAGAYNNAGNAPNASFVIDTEGGTYTYQIRAYTNNDDGVEFEVAFSTNGANPAPTYSILFNANDGSAYNSEYEIILDGALNPAVNFGAISTFNQTEKTLAVNSSTGDLSVEGAFSAFDLNIKNASGNSVIETDGAEVNVYIYGANGTQDGFSIYGGVNGTDSFLKAQPNDNGGDGVLYLDGSLKVWNTFVTNFNSFNVDRQANTSITGGDFLIEDADSVPQLKLTNANGVLEAREITNFFGGTLTLSGNIVAETQTQGDNSTKLATTEYVDTAIAGVGGSIGNFTFTNELIENTVDNAISVKASSYAQLESNNNFVYVQNDGVWIETSNPAVSEWHFDNDGHLTLPVSGLIKNNDGSTYLISTNNTWTGGSNGFVGSGYFGGTLGTFSVIDATNTFNILNVDYTNSTVEVNSNSANAFQVSNQGGGTQIFNIDGNINTITLNGNTTIQGGTLTFAIQDSGSLNVFTVDSNNGDTNISGDLIVSGDLTVNGQTTTINTTNMDVTDSLIELAHGTTGVPVNDAGFVIARGDEHNATLFWSEASDTFIFATSASINSLSTGNLLTLGGTLTYGSVRMGAISLVDDNATALDIKEGSNSYLKFDTTDGAEKVVVGKDLSLSTIKLTDNQASALDITEGANSYLKFVTTNSSEKVVFGKKIEAPADSVIADFTFQNGYITSPSNILINSQAGTTTFDDNVVVSGSFKLSQNTQEAEDNNVGVRFDYYDSSLINAPDMTTGQEYIIQSVGDTDFTLVGAFANSANVVFTVVGDASVLLAGTTGVVYPTASLTTGFFGHDKSSHVFTMYTDRTDENTIGNAKFNDLTLTSGLLIDMNGTDLIILNSAFVGIPTDNIGMTVVRGNYTDAKLIWDEGVNRWSVSNPDNTNNAVNPVPVITSTPGEGARYACYDPVFVADVYDISIPSDYTNKTAYFLSNGGVSGTVNLFDVSTNAYDGYVLALFNTDTVIMTIDGFGGQTIGGDTTKDIPAGGCLTIMARNGAWYIM